MFPSYICRHATLTIVCTENYISFMYYPTLALLYLIKLIIINFEEMATHLKVFLFENLMDREVWCVIVHGVAKSQSCQLSHSVTSHQFLYIGPQTKLQLRQIVTQFSVEASEIQICLNSYLTSCLVTLCLNLSLSSEAIFVWLPKLLEAPSFCGHWCNHKGVK